MPMIGLGWPLDETALPDLDRVGIVEAQHPFPCLIMQRQRILDAVGNLGRGLHRMRLELGEKLAIHELDLCAVKVEQGLDFLRAGFHA